MIKFFKHKNKVPEMTQEEAEEVRNDLRGRRVCVSNRRLFAATLEEIKKHDYCLIENATDEEIGFTTNSKINLRIKEIINNFKTINALLESERNEIVKCQLNMIHNTVLVAVAMKMI